VGFLEQYDPSLFSRFQRVRSCDQRLAEVFNDLETVAEELALNGGTSSVQVAGIVAELINELRARVSRCEHHRDNKTENDQNDE